MKTLRVHGSVPLGAGYYICRRLSLPQLPVSRPLTSNGCATSDMVLAHLPLSRLLLLSPESTGCQPPGFPLFWPPLSSQSTLNDTTQLKTWACLELP